MRKLIISALLAATVVPMAAQAQTAELRRDRQDIREEQRELNRAVRNGDRGDIREERRDVREARQEYRQDAREHRQDVREDWREYRQRNRTVFQRGRYTAPRGLRYNQVQVGGRIAPAFYGQRYVIADPYRYRLPRATGYQRWVRYGNDVLLVNMRTGRVLQAYSRFFW